MKHAKAARLAPVSLSTVATSPARANTGEVYDQLRADILGGVHKPGGKLKFAELGDRYGASVSVIREALTRLVEARLVESEPRIGFRVAPLSLEDLRDLTATRIDLESIAVRYAIQRGDMAWEAELVAAHHRLERTPIVTQQGPERVSDEWEAAHATFHRMVLAGCNSPRLMAMTDVLRDGSELYRRWSQPQEPGRDVLAEHRRILQAILDRDIDAAIHALGDHYRRTAEILERAYDTT